MIKSTHSTLGLMLLSLLWVGCRWPLPNQSGNDPQLDWQLSSSLERFTEEEFLDYVGQVQTYKTEQQKDISNYFPGDIQFDTASTELSAPTVAESTTGSSITNIQEQGVDEGDIVKAHGDYLIVLSRGRLFTVQVQAAGAPVLLPVFKNPAYPQDFTNGTWYDEMLVYDDTVVVIGYSYTLSATQVGLFDFQADGTLTHRNTFFIDSNDYYSSRNYASRLIGSKLIFYMPYYLQITPDGKRESAYSLPQIRYWLKGNDTTAPQAIMDPSNIYKPVQETNDPTLHTIVTCDLAQAIACSAQAVLGPYSRNFYVSPTAAYLWVNNASVDYYIDESPEAFDQTAVETERKIPQPNAHLYAMPLDGSGVGVVQTYGSPLDQFSFKEADGYLNVFLQEHGYGEAMWGAEYSDSALALLRLPLTDFMNEPVAVNTHYYQRLRQPKEDYDTYTLQNRFVGDYFLYGTGSSWYSNTSDNHVYVVDYKEPQQEIAAVDLKSSVDRIEVLGSDQAVVVGTRDTDLQFNWLQLTDRPTVIDTYTLPNAAQGETRSHGFFYSSDLDIFGLPVQTTGAQGYEQLYNESAQVVYVQATDYQFKELGALQSSGQDSRLLDDYCQFSCVDWYGNSRPIFYQNRIFALMGYELVEGQVDNQQMTEIRRAHVFNESSGRKL